VQKPTKAKKLIVSGIKECKRTIETIIDKNRSKALIVALNIERNPLRKGVDDEVQNTIKSALHINIPVIHVTTRSKLGRAFTGKFGPRITMISIVNF
jgi:ribosomal protein L7Ae-like RNA K-turn-binding protein